MGSGASFGSSRRTRGNYVVRCRHEEAETQPTAAKGAQLRAGSPSGMWGPQGGPECHHPSAGTILGSLGLGNSTLQATAGASDFYSRWKSPAQPSLNDLSDLSHRELSRGCRAQALLRAFSRSGFKAWLTSPWNGSEEKLAWLEQQTVAAHRDQNVSSAGLGPPVSSVVSKLLAKIQMVNILGFGTMLLILCVNRLGHGIYFLAKHQSRICCEGIFQIWLTFKSVDLE